MEMTTTADRVFQSFLRPYQRRFVEDWSRRIIVLKSRRIGFTEAVLLKSFLEAKASWYHDVYVCSTSWVNAKEMIRRLTIWLDAMGRAGMDLGVTARRKTEIEFSNGSRIIAMPAMSVRGRGGTIVLDEFAFYQWDREVWAGVSPAAETDPRMRLILISTPWGASGEFWKIWTDQNGEYGDWSRHRIDIYDAVSEGFPVDVELLRRKYPDDIWRQEFCCEFVSDINQYFPHDLLRRSLYSPEDLEGGQLPDGQRYFGVDLASIRDASVLASMVKTPIDFWVEHPHTIKPAGQSRDYADQFVDIDVLISEGNYRRGAIDASGEGAQLAQEARSKYGRERIREVRNWPQVYDLIPSMRLAMERNRFWLPNDRAVRTAFTKISKRITTSNNEVYEATRDAQGHADEFFAILLAWYAANDDVERPPARAGGVGRRFTGGW